MKTFTASRVADGQGLFPCKIIVGANKITVRIPGLFSNQDKDIPFDKISEVSVDTPLVGYSTIRFYTTGVGIVSAHGFTKSEVKEIKQLIDNPSLGSSNTKSSDAKNHEPYESVSTGKISYNSSISEDEWDNLRPVERNESVSKPSAELENTKVTNNQEKISPKNLSAPILSSRLSERLNRVDNRENVLARRAEFENIIRHFKMRLEVYDSEFHEDQKNILLIYALSETLADEIKTLKNNINLYAEAIEETIEEEVIRVLDNYDKLGDKVSFRNKLKELSDDEISKLWKENFKEKIPVIDEAYKLYLSMNEETDQKRMLHSKIMLYWELLGLHSPESLVNTSVSKNASLRHLLTEAKQRFPQMNNDLYS